MTNDEIERRANQIVTNWRQDSAVCESISLVNYVRAAIHLAVTAALEEAAKVALDHDCKRDYCSAACVFGIGKSIRALIPGTGTKE